MLFTYLSGTEQLMAVNSYRLCTLLNANYREGITYTRKREIKTVINVNIWLVKKEMYSNASGINYMLLWEDTSDQVLNILLSESLLLFFPFLN